MKIRSLFLLPFLLCSFYSMAQDTIFKTDGTAILAKVIEVSPSQVKFRLPDTPPESLLVIYKREVAAISYSGGLKEVYRKTAPKEIPYDKPVTSVLPVAPLTTRNIITINCLDMAFANFTLSYERIFGDGKYSFRIPVSVGLGGRPVKQQYDPGTMLTLYWENRIAGTGLEFNLYPFGQRPRATMYVGISGEIGNFNYYNNVHDTVLTPYSGGSGYYTSYPEKYKEKHIASHYAGMIHIGGYLRVAKSFIVGAQLGIGYKREETIFEDYTMFKAQLNITAGYRF